MALNGINLALGKRKVKNKSGAPKMRNNFMLSKYLFLTFASRKVIALDLFLIQ